MQVPQELSCLTHLTRLYLSGNWHAAPCHGAPSGEAAYGTTVRRKMHVTPEGCRFLLSFSALDCVYLGVTKEDRDALEEFIEDINKARKREVVQLYVG